MTSFEVWAPGKTVRLLVDGEEREMEPGDDGWWRLDVPGAGHGSDYAYQLSGEESPLPDPRSAWQPHGVHGEEPEGEQTIPVTSGLKTQPQPEMQVGD